MNKAAIFGLSEVKVLPSVLGFLFFFKVCVTLYMVYNTACPCWYLIKEVIIPCVVSHIDSCVSILLVFTSDCHRLKIAISHMLGSLISCH